MPDDEEYVTASEARQLLDVSRGKLAAMIKSGELPTYPDPRNKLVKLVKKSDIEAWLARAVRPPKKHQARGSEPMEGGQRQQLDHAA